MQFICAKNPSSGNNKENERQTKQTQRRRERERKPSLLQQNLHLEFKVKPNKKNIVK